MENSGSGGSLWDLLGRGLAYHENSQIRKAETERERIAASAKVETSLFTTDNMKYVAWASVGIVAVVFLTKKMKKG